MLGQMLAAPAVIPGDLPPFDNTAMDGFALRAGAARLPVGAHSDVLGAQAAGAEHVPADGEARETMSSARMPASMDTVAPVEQVTLL